MYDASPITHHELGLEHNHSPMKSWISAHRRIAFSALLLPLATNNHFGRITNCTHGSGAATGKVYSIFTPHRHLTYHGFTNFSFSNYQHHNYSHRLLSSSLCIPLPSFPVHHLYLVRDPQI